MRVLLATHTMAQIGGGTTYLFALARQLQRAGHDVTLYGVDRGRMAEIAIEEGFRLVTALDRLPAEQDAFISQDHDVALELHALDPTRPHVFVIHSRVLDINVPPNVPDVVDAVVALNDDTRRHVEALAGRFAVHRLRQPIDLDRFAQRREPAPVARRVLVFGNFMRGQRIALLEQACRDVGLECRIVGFHTAPTEDPELELNDADIVVGKGRVILEAMACGRAAYVYDDFGGDGWVTARSYPIMEAEGFSGQSDPDVTVDLARLTHDFRAYDPAMGAVNRDLVLQHHDVIEHADEVVALLRALAPSCATPPRATDELVRLVRLAWNHEARAHHLAHQSEMLWARIDELRARIDELEDEVRRRRDAGDARDWLEQAEERLRLAREIEDRGEAFRGSARYRLAEALGRPVDALRRRRS